MVVFSFFFFLVQRDSPSVSQNRASGRALLLPRDCVTDHPEQVASATRVCPLTLCSGKPDLGVTMLEPRGPQSLFQSPGHRLLARAPPAPAFRLVSASSVPVVSWGRLGSPRCLLTPEWARLHLQPRFSSARVQGRGCHPGSLFCPQRGLQCQF